MSENQHQEQHEAENLLTARKAPLLGMTMAELESAVKALGMPRYSTRQLAEWLYQHHVWDISQMSNLSLRHRAVLKEHYTVGVMPPTLAQRSQDGTVKYLFPTQSGHNVEAVYIPDGERATLCVSCQVGCRMGCRFCMTGRQGFQGNLTVTDIINQIESLPEREQLTNIVFMGQGEPMDNLDAVLKATTLLTADYAYTWSPRRITVSSVGLRQPLERFIKESQCHLAISLHNPFPEQRRQMMPAENGCSLSELISMLRTYDWSHQRRLSFEYIVFDGINDSPSHARELIRLLGQTTCRINLIPFHQSPDSPYRGASHEKMVSLRDYLSRHGLTATIRASRGEDIMAACGLLNTKKDESVIII